MSSENLNKPIGRPSEYRPEFCQMLLDHMKEAHSFESFGAIAGVSKQTMYTWCKQHEAFLDARKRGRVLAQFRLEEIGHKIMTGRMRGNPAVWIFFMKNMSDWRDDIPPEDEDIDGLDFV